MRNAFIAFLRRADLLLAPFVYLAASLLRVIRWNLNKMPASKRALLKAGAFPVVNHFYDPLFDPRQLRFPLDQERNLPGIDWNVDEQLRLLEGFSYAEEIREILQTGDDERPFRINNTSFSYGDADFLYSMIRHMKPAKVLEIGSGNSTLVAAKAIRKNQAQNPGYTCQHICIEPYMALWLEKMSVTVIRERVEHIDKALFSELASGDLLFIDSSHIIRPQGDVLFEYLEVLPTLAKGVTVHVHDIFSPRDYPKEWIVDNVWFWNEQYLLEAFLSCNQEWKIIGALNLLRHNHFEKFQAKCPFLSTTRDPGSFYIQKVV